MKTKELNSNYSVMPIPLTMWLLALAVGIFFGLASVASAQPTFVPPAPATGHWSQALSPYYVVDNVSVPSGQTLTIDPGATVLIGSNLTITANGSLIQAVGTPSQRITIGSQSSTFFFNAILVQNQTGTNRFKYCDFANAQTAISMGMYGNNQTMPVEIMNCTFSNCVQQAIYGEAIGPALCGNGCSGNYTAIASLNPVIKNCAFSGTSNGCILNISGAVVNCNCSLFGGPYGYGYGVCNPVINANIFQNLTGTAFLMRVGSYAGGGNPVFVNNTMVNCRVGTDATDPWDLLAQDNIFVGATNGVKVSGSLSRGISYNDFFGNATNFTGLPTAWGTIIGNNRNGTPADAILNIFQNPLFVATNDIHLQTNSPCVNAGTPNNAYANMCFPPSIATNFPDLGAYGGPDACNWLDPVPILPAQLTMVRSNASVWLNWNAIPRSSYRVEYVATNSSLGLNPTSITNKWLTNSVQIPLVRPVSMVVATSPYTNRS